MTDLRRIAFRIDPGESPDWPDVTVLVDDEDVIGRATRFRGFDPDELFGADAPLLPTVPPRRVAIYRCSCGEPGCACAACIVSEMDGIVHWQDFRDFVGVYGKATVSDDPTGGKRLALPDLSFDAEQYRAAVQRASADRGWETDRRRVARLLRARLIAGDEALDERGYKVGWVSPEWEREDSFNVELRVPRGQVVVRVDADWRLSENDLVEEMASTLLHQSERRWHVLHRNHWPEP